MPATDVVELGPLDREDATELVGATRADELYERSGGNPLFLSELLLSKSDELPASLVDAISTRCDDLGAASMTLRSAAVIGSRIDLDLLAAVLNRPAVDVLDDIELGAARLLLVDDAGTFRFRHALVRTALAASSTAARAAWLHRQVGRVLAQRGGIDPLEIAEHARLGGDVELAAASLRAAAVRAAEHFDHTTAEALLDDALSLHPSSELLLERARVRTRRGVYVGAYEDVAAAADLGPLASEVGAWASYYDRRLDQAYEFAMDGVARADDVALRARCLSIAGRIKHAIGELPAAESLLTEAVQLATGTDRIRASAWLGVLRAHQSRTRRPNCFGTPATRSSAPSTPRACCTPCCSSATSRLSPAARRPRSKRLRATPPRSIVAGRRDSAVAARTSPAGCCETSARSTIRPGCTTRRSRSPRLAW